MLLFEANNLFKFGINRLSKVLDKHEGTVRQS